jgi:hypothetical protein
MKVFLERYKNVTLLEGEEREELFSKTIMSISGIKDIGSKLTVLEESINKNIESMLTWKLLVEAPEDADAERAGATTAGDVAPEALDVSGEDMGAEEGMTDEAGAPGSEDAEIPSDDMLEPVADKEVAIVNALLSVIEKIFWNGNQENKELANLIKELRDMREAGNFSEDRLAEIFTDLFDITQQVASNMEQESPAGEEGETIPEEGEEGAEETPAEPTAEELPAETPAEEPTPLDNY